MQDLPELQNRKIKGIQPEKKYSSSQSVENWGFLDREDLTVHIEMRAQMISSGKEEKNELDTLNVLTISYGHSKQNK